MKAPIALSLVFAAGLAGACATTIKAYDGPTLPERKLASLATSPDIQLYAIDGKEVASLHSPELRDWRDNIEYLVVAPGHHEVRAGFFHAAPPAIPGAVVRRGAPSDLESPPVQLGFDVEIEHTYRVLANACFASPSAAPTFRYTVGDVTWHDMAPAAERQRLEADALCRMACPADEARCVEWRKQRESAPRDRSARPPSGGMLSPISGPMVLRSPSAAPDTR